MEENDSGTSVLGSLLGVAKGAARRTLAGAGQVERFAMTVLKDRLDRVEYPSRHHGLPVKSERDSEREHASLAVAVKVSRRPKKAADLLKDLLERGLEQSEEAAQEALYHSLVQQLVPDEVRMLSALSDGAAMPMIQVLQGGAFRREKIIIDNHSPLAKRAGVCLMAHAGYYLDHLRRIGLVDVGDEIPNQKTPYELLESDGPVRETVGRGSRVAGQRAWTVRRSVRLSALGAELWRACAAPSVITPAPPEATVVATQTSKVEAV